MTTLPDPVGSKRAARPPRWQGLEAPVGTGVRSERARHASPSERLDRQTDDRG